MKHLFSARLLRQGMAGALLGLFFSGAFYLAPAPASRLALGHAAPTNEAEADEDEEADGDHVYADRPDLALEQDVALTRDPATGTVPRERLLDAARYNAAALAQRPTGGSIASGTWTERGPSNVAGRILALLVDPTDATGSTVWAGAAGGGLWKGTNAATGPIRWASVNSSLTNLAISAIAAVPGSSPQVLYCGTGEGYFNADAIQGAGIWKSSDNGATWAQLPSTNTPSFYHVQKIVVHPVTRDLYAATRTGLWRSQNAGTSWSLVLGQSTTPATATPRVADLEIGADNTLFAAFGIFSSDGIYRSASGDAGSWTKLNASAAAGLPTTDFQRIELACAPSDAKRLYALFQSSATGRPLLGAYRSLDGGDTWAVMARPGATTGVPTYDFTNGQGWYDLAAAVSPTDPNTLYVGGLDLWLTTNAGETDPTRVSWIRESSWSANPSASYFVHADQHVIAFVPTATAPATRAYFGNDGGVFYSANATAPSGAAPIFAGRNTGLNVTQFYAVAMHPSSYNYFLAGAQDNGTQQFTAAGFGTTTTATGGDGGFCAIDQINPLVQFTSYVYNQYRRSLNGGGSFSTFNFDAKRGLFINPFDYDGRNGALYGAYATDSCLVWTNANVAAPPVINKPSLGAGTGKVTHVTVAPITKKRIYVGTNAGMVLRVDSASTAAPIVKILRPSQGSISVSCVAVDPANEQHLLVTYANYGIVSVYETTNADAPAPTWTSVEGALPDMPVRWALFDPRNPARALLATEMGVYSTERLSGAATAWEPAGNGPINTRVDMLRYRPGDQVVAAATHGRGLFTSDVLAVAPLATGAPAAAPALLRNVFPNPFGPTLNLELGEAPAGDVAVVLTDALGRRAFATTLHPTARQMAVPVPAALAPGPYVLTVRGNGRQSSRHVLKQ